MKIRLSIVTALLALGTALVGVPAPAQAQVGLPDDATIPMCVGVGSPRPVVTGLSTFEAVAFDTQGSMLVSDWIGNKVHKLTRPGGQARVLTELYAPGGLAPHPDGTVLVGSGIAMPAMVAPQIGGRAELYKVNTRTGAKRKVADGLSMGNGVVRAPDGTVYASNDLAPAIDKISPDGKVHSNWFSASTANGLALSEDGKTLYANVSLGDTRILAIDTATGKARTYFRPPAGLSWVFLDDLDIDAHGNLYAAVYFGGQVWRISPHGDVCAVAKGLVLSAGISVGPTGPSPFRSDSVFVTTHTGQVLEIPHGVRAH